MRPVPRYSGSGLKDSRPDTQRSTTPGLQWRSSNRVAPAKTEATIAPSSQPAASSESPVQPVVSEVAYAESPSQTTMRIVSAQHPHQTQSAVHPQPADVQQARYQKLRSPDSMELAQADDGFSLPPGLTPKAPVPTIPAPTIPAPTIPAPTSPSPSMPAPTMPGLGSPQAAPKPQDNVIDPFADDEPAAPLDTAPNQKPPVAPGRGNGLRPTQPQIDEVDPSIADDAEEATKDDSMNEVLPPDNETPAPNPFDRARDRDANGSSRPQRNLEDFDLPAPRNRQRDQTTESPAASEEIRRSFAFSCDEFRKSIAEATIQKVSLDISPPFRPDVIELDEFEKLKNKFDESQEVREWRSIDGRKLGRGKLIDLAYEKVVIETEFGTQEELPINRISEADLAYLSKNWGLPQECLIEQTAYVPRNWRASTVTWKASNLCHKPLYFEEVNLERYGHTAGPFAQPIVSTAHFFVNIAVLPYKMGVHAPNECQYTLGYYRPGDCAPWIVPPVPISLRGGLYQAAAVTGAFWLIP